jgi:hypothetical protein
MAFKYDEDEVVALTMDYPEIGLHKGDKGVIWALYATEPPYYEATFRLSDGSLLDMTVGEDEIAALDFVEPANAKVPVG